VGSRTQQAWPRPLTRVTVEEILAELERQVIALAEGLAVSEAVSALSASAASLARKVVSDYVAGGS
jgi:hypothetical protein